MTFTREELRGNCGQGWAALDPGMGVPPVLLDKILDRRAQMLSELSRRSLEGTTIRDRNGLTAADIAAREKCIRQIAAKRQDCPDDDRPDEEVDPLAECDCRCSSCQDGRCQDCHDTEFNSPAHNENIRKYYVNMLEKSLASLVYNIS